MTKAPYLVNSLFVQEKNLDPNGSFPKKNQSLADCLKTQKRRRSKPTLFYFKNPCNTSKGLVHILHFFEIFFLRE